MKMGKRTLSIALALIMAIGMFVVSSSAAGPADYSAVENAILTELPSATDRYFYTDEAMTLIDDTIGLIDLNLQSESQSVVDGYVTMIEDLGALLNKTVTDASQSPLQFAYGTSFSFAYVYPYGTSGLAFYPLRDEQKAVNTLALDADKTAVPLVHRIDGDQTFTVTLSLGSNALICAGNIPVLFDKTKLEVVSVDNLNSTVLANKYDFDATQNPVNLDFWPEIYRNDTAFKAQWGGITINITPSYDSAPYSVVPTGQEDVLNINFKVKAGATAGDAVVYIDPNFGRDAYNRTNSLYIGRAKADAGPGVVQYDELATYGATIDTAAAIATVKIAGVILGDTDLNGTVSARDALMTLQASAGTISVPLSDLQRLQANVDTGGSDPGEVTARDALKILQYSAGLITSF